MLGGESPESAKLSVPEGSALWNAIGLENRASVTADGSTPLPSANFRKVDSDG